MAPPLRRGPKTRGMRESKKTMAREVWENIRLTGEHVIDRVRAVVREGNVRQIAVRQGDRVVAIFPLTVGVFGVVASPVLAAVGALAALLTDCTIEIERRAPDAEAPPPPAEAGPRRRPTTRRKTPGRRAATPLRRAAARA